MMSIRRHFILFILITFYFGQHECFFKSKIKKLKEKAKGIYQKNFGKNKTWHFLGKDPSLYPGADTKYKAQNSAKWEEYYACLTEQERSLSKEGSIVPEAILGFDGGFVRFECKICISPIEQANSEITWYSGEIGKQYLELVLYGEHIMLSPEDQSLHIYNLKPFHSGQYACILGDSVTAPYYLTVVNGNNLFEVFPPESEHGPFSKDTEDIEYKLQVSNEWGEWTGCSTCDKIGKRHKIGYCTVSYNYKEAINSGVLEKRSFSAQNLKHMLFNESFRPSLPKSKSLNKSISELDIQLVQVFKQGIPCRSHILAEGIRNLPKVQYRLDEIIIGFCRRPCNNKQIFEVKNDKGQVIEKVNNSAGIYSKLQGIPPTAPAVDRLLQYERMGTDVIIKCPGSLNTDSPILWQIDSKNVVPEIIAEESKDRIYVSLLDRIHVHHAKVSDSKLYSCWQNNELAGTVRLVVEKKLKLSFNHHIMLFGIVIILSTFLYVFVKAFFGRKYAKMGRK